MQMPTVGATCVKVATWSDLGDRSPAYALVAGVDLVVVRFDDQISVMFGALPSQGCSARGWAHRRPGSHLRGTRMGLSLRHRSQRIQQRRGPSSLLGRDRSRRGRGLGR